MTVSVLVQAAFIETLRNERELHDRWNRVHARIWSGAPQAQQSDGRIDILLRRLEAEKLVEMEKPASLELMYAMEMQLTLSRYWVLSIYENLRSLCLNVAIPKSQAILTLHSRFDLVRIPLAKGEIAKDRNLEEEITLVRLPHGPGEGEPDPKQYGKNAKVHFPIPTGVCLSTGSICWYPIDSKTLSQQMISRRMLSDECLAAFD